MQHPQALASRQSWVHPVCGSLRPVREMQEGATNTSSGTESKTGGEGVSERERNNTSIKSSSLLLTILRLCRNTGQTLLSSEPVSFTSHIWDFWAKKCQRSSNAAAGAFPLSPAVRSGAPGFHVSPHQAPLITFPGPPQPCLPFQSCFDTSN